MRSRVLFPLLASLSLTACKGKPTEAAAGPPRDAGTSQQQQRLYVLGSTIHLRKAPSADAESLEKLLIGTECAPLEPVQGEWRNVRCGDKEGYASAPLLGTEKPSVEKLKAEARDVKLTLTQRQDAALRAATLAPEDAELSKELGDLFFERNFELLAGLKKPLKGPELSYPCPSREEIPGCIASSADVVRNVKRRAVTKGKGFVVAIGDAEQILVYRGRFSFDKEYTTLTQQVLERTRFTPTPVMERALFSGIEADDIEADSTSPRLGQFVLDAASQAILEELFHKWWLLKRSDDGAHAVRRNECVERNYPLELSSDIHGRWRAELVRPGVALPEERWVSSVSKTKRGTSLTLVRSAEDTEPQVFEVPADGGEPATLGEALYTYRRSDYPEHSEPCGSVEAVGPSFSGEFQPEKAMVALYGRFDAASNTSRWIPTLAERWSASWLENFRAERYQARPWKWATWREGEQQQMLFLTETRSEPAGHPSTALIGGGIFSRTEEGWRLERARRVVTELGSFGAAPGDDISVHAVSPRGFVAVLGTGYTATGTTMSSLVLLSDVGVQEAIALVGTIPDTGETNEGSCDSGEDEDEQPSYRSQCYSYDSEWKFVPRAGNALPDFVVTTAGTRIHEGSQDFEDFYEVRTFSASRGSSYSLESLKKR